MAATERLIDDPDSDFAAALEYATRLVNSDAAAESSSAIEPEDGT